MMKLSDLPKVTWHASDEACGRTRSPNCQPCASVTMQRWGEILTSNEQQPCFKNELMNQREKSLLLSSHALPFIY